MKLKLIDKIEQVSGVSSFILESPKEINWLAGQYMSFNLPHKNVDSEGDIRYFTISNAPAEKNIAFTTRITNSSFKRALAGLPIGSEIDAEDPEGNFTLPTDRDNVVFIAGGIGITPFRSILVEASCAGKMKNIELIYANRDKNVIFSDLLNGIAANFSALKINYIFDPKRIDKTLLKKYLSPKKYYYISGPEPMVKSIAILLQELGINKKWIVEDFFPGYKDY